MKDNTSLLNKITWYDIDEKGNINMSWKNQAAIYIYMKIPSFKSKACYYVGSTIKLTIRTSLHKHDSAKWLSTRKGRGCPKFYNHVAKYGWNNFKFGVLEYIDLSEDLSSEKIKSVILSREQYYLDNINPSLNINKIANSRLGSKHSAETLLKFKDRKLSAEALINLKKSKAGVTPVYTPLRKINHLLATGHITTIVNKENNSVKLYDSIRAAARDLGTSHNSLLNYINTNKLYNGIYIITRKTKT